MAAYTLAGFWLVPLLIKNQVPKFGQTELARQATIGEVRFNPYTLRLEVQDLRLAEANGAPLVAIGKLAVALQWQSLVRRAWSFAEIRISAPSASLVIAPDGKFNIAELLATFARRPHEASTDTRLPRLIIGRFALEQGKVDMHDRRAGYTNSFFPIDFELTNFSTLADQNDSYTFSAESARGGKLRWKGTASMNPIRGSGELTLENASLPELAVYLKSYTRATVAAGQLAATLPYRFSYSDGKLEASLAGASLALRDLALAHAGASDSFATLTRLDVSDISADLARREATVGEVRADAGKLTFRRDAKGELDLAQLLGTATAPAVAPDPGQAPVINNWKLGVKQVIFDQLAISAVDETVSPALKLNADHVRLHLQLLAEQAGADFKLTLADAAFSLADLALTSGSQTPFKLAQLGFADGTLDLAARRASLGRLYAEGGQLQLTRDRKGQLNILGLLPRFGAASAAAATPAASSAAAPWIALAKSVELSKIGAQVEDQGTGIKVHVQDLAVKLDGASSDLAQSVKFNAGLNLREGGQLSAQGRVMPASGALEADVQVKQLALAPLQPLLSKYLKLKIAGGSVSAQGRLTSGSGQAKSPSLRYVGGVDIAGLALNEEDGERFAAWRSVSANRLTASLSPNLLEIPELRLVEPNATLIIENDRSFNAARLLVRPATSSATAESPPPTPGPVADDPFPVRIQRLRVQNAKLDFTDLSLRPQFGAKIYELNGVLTGLSSNRASRSQIELDGRVDEFGLARIRGELNPFAPRDNTDVNVVFKNVDMVSTSPYTMKFAGYKIAEGKISLDLQYKLRKSQLEGANQIVIDKLTLGERVDSPDALKLPLELAIAILKDSDGRIDLGLPVSGNMNDPQFSYGALVWKAVSNVLTRIVSAPFRALGSRFGISGEKLEAIDFDPGSDKLLPPEREKLKQVAQILSKRAQLKLSVPGQYSEVADGAALKARAVRAEIAQRAGLKLEAGEEPGPVDLRDRAVRNGVRGLYAERFGAAELDRQKKVAEGGGAAPAGEPAVPDVKTEAAQEKLPLWQRVGKLIQGEPQVADASAFYRKLQERLEQNQPLAADVLNQLGAQRASAILATLKDAGVDPSRALAAPPENVSSDVGKPVSLKLGLAAK
ncbi:MAG: DUF748 domain-containing protein [Rhodoferax sp.]|nr:DUF748 domain-containing protein [Rhodoferax sp.]